LFIFGAQEGFAVWLDPKVTKRSSRKKPSAHRPAPGPVFLQAFTLFKNKKTRHCELRAGQCERSNVAILER
jgi:hypothetical protein